MARFRVHLSAADLAPLRALDEAAHRLRRLGCVVSRDGLSRWAARRASETRASFVDVLGGLVARETLAANLAARAIDHQKFEEQLRSLGISPESLGGGE